MGRWRGWRRGARGHIGSANVFARVRLTGDVVPPVVVRIVPIVCSPHLPAVSNPSVIIGLAGLPKREPGWATVGPHPGAFVCAVVDADPERADIVPDTICEYVVLLLAVDPSEILAVKYAISTGLGPRARRVVDIKWAEICVGSWRRWRWGERPRRWRSHPSQKG